MKTQFAIILASILCLLSLFVETGILSLIIPIILLVLVLGIMIGFINEMANAPYNQPTKRVFTVYFDILGEDERTITIANEEYRRLIMHSENHEELDSEIYYYVENSEIDLPANIICRYHLDQPLVFIREEKLAEAIA